MFQSIGAIVLVVVGVSLLMSKSETGESDADDTKTVDNNSGLFFGWTLSALNPALLGECVDRGTAHW